MILQLPLSNICHCTSHFQAVEQQSVVLIFGPLWLVKISIFIYYSSTLDHVLYGCAVLPYTSDNSLSDQRLYHQKESVGLRSFASSYGFDSGADVFALVE